MGKIDAQQLQQQQQMQEGEGGGSSAFFCESCSIGLARIGKAISFKCIFILILSVAVFFSAVLWLPPFHPFKSVIDAYDAPDLNATVQASFRLPKSVSLLVHHIGTLESDILAEIGVPNTTVSIISLHRSVVSNSTDVVFGVLPVSKNVPINTVSLSVLRSSLIELVLGHMNLSLTTSIFGHPSFFQILKFPGGITVIPGPSVSIWQIPQILFNFTLYNSVSQIQENFDQFNDQLKFGLHLRSYENVYVQVTNKNGSTLSPPVTVQASVISAMGNHYLLPQRLKQLAQTITGSPPAKNLGLNNSVFGKVKEISLSSILNCTLHGSPSPSPSPSYAPAPSPHHQFSRCLNCDNAHPKTPEHDSQPPSAPVSKTPAPSVVPSRFPRKGPYSGSIITPSPSPTVHSDTSTPELSPHAAILYQPSLHNTPQLSPKISPKVFYGPSPESERSGEVSKSVLSPILPSPSSSVARLLPCKEVWLLGLLGPLIFLLCRLC